VQPGGQTTSNQQTLFNSAEMPNLASRTYAQSASTKGNASDKLVPPSFSQLQVVHCLATGPPPAQTPPSSSLPPLHMPAVPLCARPHHTTPHHTTPHHTTPACVLCSTSSAPPDCCRTSSAPQAQPVLQQARAEHYMCSGTRTGAAGSSTATVPPSTTRQTTPPDTTRHQLYNQTHSTCTICNANVT
jgi:hypothetical protein